ncbi:aminotransferase class III-fold pyridoxal phosphate-dependent enzyme, partial [Rhizobium ruizarguesonis]
DDLERLVQLHGAETIAAVIVEPMSVSAGVVLPSKCYLEKLRATADKHGILLIFDEVITGFGRLGTPSAWRNSLPSRPSIQGRPSMRPRSWWRSAR